MKKLYATPTLITEDVTLGVFGQYNAPGFGGGAAISWIFKIVRRWRWRW